MFRAHHAVDEALPSGNGLNLVEKAADLFGVFFLRIERAIGFSDQTEMVLLQRVEAVIETVIVSGKFLGRS
ncbi:protein of unknown function [Candidatus Methylomirabilis oxygeniifera]|uniref:Uncharacterized protein n=1 Tax=Methylomirabilis oxygeniifera TaxID=671143 RepID=D5MLI9_METO1|nr:protein of unknown function [Candidatus Methylomirabilis oxyfera]